MSISETVIRMFPKAFCVKRQNEPGYFIAIPGDPTYLGEVGKTEEEAWEKVWNTISNHMVNKLAAKK